MRGLELRIHSQASTMVCEWINNFIPHITGHVIIYPCWLKLIKGAPGQQQQPPCWLDYDYTLSQESYCAHGTYIILQPLNHLGRVTHVCVSKITIIGSDNGFSPGRRQAIIWTNVGILLIGPLGTNFSEILIEIYAFSFKKRRFKMSSGKWRPFCLGLNVLINQCSREVRRSASSWLLWYWRIHLLTAIMLHDKTAPVLPVLVRFWPYPGPFW